MVSRAKRSGSGALAGAALLLGVFLVMGCGSSASNEQFEEVSYDDLEGYLPAPIGSLTFSEEVAPIAFQHCAVCHRPGGSAPFSLLTYTDFKQHAKQIATATDHRIMPPWQPEPEHGDFLGQRRLSSDEIGIIRQWAAEGTPEGSPDDLPPTPQWSQRWQLGEPDLVVELTEPYTLSPAGSDVTRSFVIPISGSENQYIKAVELQSGDPNIVFHARLSIDYSNGSRRRDEQDPEAGFDPLSDPKAPYFPSGPFYIWTPAKMPFETPDELVWPVTSDVDLVLQLRMHPGEGPETIQPKIGIYFTDEPPTRYSMTLVLRSEVIEIPAGEKEYVITDSYVLPMAVDVLSVYPHAHHLGKEMKVFASLPDGRRKWLVHIDDWDFNRQDEYRLAEPMLLPEGTTISMRFTYDNTAANEHNPHEPPQPVGYGRETTDEMAEVALQVASFTNTDYVLLQKDYAAKNQLTVIAGLEHAIEIDSNAAAAHNDLGMEMLRLRKPKEAGRHFTAALEIRPDFVEALTNQGILLQKVGKLDDARSHIERALEIAPDSDRAQFHLGFICQIERKLAEAVKHYERALQLNPDNFEANNNLGLVLIGQGNPAAAKSHFDRAVQIMPTNALAHNNLGMALASMGDLTQARAHFEYALAIQPDYGDARKNLEKARSLLRQQK